MKSPAVPKNAQAQEENGFVNRTWLLFHEEFLRKAADESAVNQAIFNSTHPLKWNGPAGTNYFHRIGTYADGKLYLSVNLSYDSGTSAWNFDNVSYGGMLVTFTALGFATFAYSLAGPNPPTLVESGQFDLRYGALSLQAADPGASNPGSLLIGGTEVVGKRRNALTPSISAPAGTAGATYTAAEQSLINSLVASVANLTTRVNELENRLKAGTGHGLFEA